MLLVVEGLCSILQEGLRNAELGPVWVSPTPAPVRPGLLYVHVGVVQEEGLGNLAVRVRKLSFGTLKAYISRQQNHLFCEALQVDWRQHPMNYGVLLGFSFSHNKTYPHKKSSEHLYECHGFLPALVARVLGPSAMEMR